MAKNNQELSYFSKYRNILEKTIKEYKINLMSENLFLTNDYAIFHTIESGITKFPLRYYQMEALFILDYLIKCHLEKPEKKELLEIVDKETKKKAPFLSYEMATGSGKTMLMGACIYYLNQKHGINNFLVITPSSTDIYRKTIRNFEIGNFESVWADDTPFKFNLINGDNYTQNLFFDDTKEANIFIFNISKFGTNATNTEKTWESAIWKDNNGNSVSIKKFLKDKKLVIITDEAHHAQTPVAKKIIQNFHPDLVLEFTATAIDEDNSKDKKNQTIVYKYNIRRFLEDGHGKLVRAVALASDGRRNQNEIDSNEKLKLITLFLIHLLKKKAVLQDSKARHLKPISFVKVKNDTTYSRKIFNYIKNDLYEDVENIQIIFEKINQQELEITELLKELIENDYQNNLDSIRKEIKKIASTAIFYYGESDKETEKKFLNIKTNEVEIVVYMQRLDEGIDLANIYTMAVINDNTSDFKTSVKQIIGRGVRLVKDKREFDDEINLLKANSEKLHIVCDQGRNFEEVVLAIQKEFGLNNKYISFDKEKETVTNKVKDYLLDRLYIPHIKADFKSKPQVSLMDLIKDSLTVVNKFIDSNCFEGENDTEKRFIKYKPESFFLEVDVFADKTIFHKEIQDNGGMPTTLIIGDSELKKIYNICQKQLHCIPETETTRKAFKEYIQKFKEKELKFYKVDESDEKLAKNFFVNSFSFFYKNHIEKNYFILDFIQLRQDDSWYLKNNFKEYEIKIPKDQVKNKTRINEQNKQILTDLIDNQYHFYGFEKSIYDYDKFDSHLEYQLAFYGNGILFYNKDKKDFWIRNQRNIHFTYGTKKYFPDFIFYKDGYIYIIETKGEIFADSKKYELLRKIDDCIGDENIQGFKGVLVYTSLMDKMGEENWDWERFLEEAELAIQHHQEQTLLVQDPPESEKFIKYVPVYTPEKAYKKFVKEQKTPKPDGWLLVDEVDGNYPDTVFATQIKGLALFPKYDNNSWILLNHTTEIGKALNNLSLVYNESIKDNYSDNYTIRIVSAIEKETINSLFTERSILLSPINDSSKTIEISNIISGKEVEIIGVKL